MNNEQCPNISDKFTAGEHYLQTFFGMQLWGCWERLAAGDLPKDEDLCEKASALAMEFAGAVRFSKSVVCPRLCQQNKS